MTLVLAVDFTPAGRAADALHSAQQPLMAAGAVEQARHDAGWLAVALHAWRPAPAGAASPIAITGDQLVAVDGWLATGSADALCRERPFLTDAGRPPPDGSFAIVAAELAARRGALLTDRCATRPLFAAWNAERLLVAGELKCLATAADLRGPLDSAGIASLLLNAYYLADRTCWRNVRALGPATRLEFADGRVAMSCYAPLAFDHSGAGIASSADYAAAIESAVAGVARRFARPVVALSGGVDSRTILAACRRARLDLPTVTWSYASSDRAASDLAVARQLAAAAGTRHREHHLRHAALADEAAELVYASDGQVGHLGAFADRQRLARELGDEFDAILFGDQCYRGESACATPSDAVSAIGILPADARPAVALLRFLLRRDRCDTALHEYGAAIEQMLASAGPARDPQALHDRLYWQVRLPRLIVGPKSLWRRRIEPVSPLLAAPLLELSARLPGPQRVHKRYLRERLAELEPDWQALDFAGESSRVKWRDVLRQRGPFQRFIVETLLDPLPAFDDWFDRAALEAGLARALVERPARRGRVPLRTRVSALFAGPLMRPPLVLSLLTIKLWLARHAGGAA